VAKTRIKAVVFDLDGTLYLGGAALPGAAEVVKSISQRCPVWYLTNNTSRTPEQYSLKLKGMGFPAEVHHVITPLLSAVALLHHQGNRKLWVLANAGVLSWLDHHLQGVDLRSPLDTTELVLLTYDDNLQYQSLCEVAWRLQREGVQYWATHPDKVCPASPGPIPDVGSYIELLASATGRRPERILGKPDPRLLTLVTAHKNYDVSELLFVGDRLYTDYELARSAGCHFALTLTGEAKRTDLANLENPPAVVVDNLAELGEHFEFGS